MKTKVGIAIYQMIVIFKGWGRPSQNFNLIKGTLGNIQKQFSICKAEQSHIVWMILDLGCFFVLIIHIQGASYKETV